MCQLCTVTVIAGLGISRLLGIDDTIASLWIGGLILSLTFVTIDWINKKWPKLQVKKWQLILFALMYVLVLLPLKFNGSIGIAGNALWGIDKIILGVLSGSIFFLFGIWMDKKIRTAKGRQLFKFQKVVLPVISLIIASIIFYFLTA